MGRFSFMLYYYYYQFYDEDEEFWYFKTVKKVILSETNMGYDVTLATILAIHTIKVLLILKVSRTFGPMIEILLNMLKQVGVFSIIYSCVFFIFFISMRILFFSIPEFQGEKDAFLTLFSASLNSFKFEIFNNDDMLIDSWFGFITMILFLGVFSVTLLNFLIAIISNVYNKLSQSGIGLYLKSLINIRQILQNDEKYSSLVSAVPPFNVVVFFFIPFILWFESKKLNTILLHYAYAYVLIVAVVVYSFIAILSIPIAYLVILVNLIKDLLGLRVKSKKSNCIILADTVIFLIFGVIILIIQTWMDIVKFSDDLYNTNLIIKYDSDNSVGGMREKTLEDIDPRFYHLFLKFLKQYPLKEVPSKKLIKDLGEVFNIYHQIRGLIFHDQDFNSKPEM